MAHSMDDRRTRWQVEVGREDRHVLHGDPMGPAEVIDVARDAIQVLLQISGPVMMVGLVVGLVVSIMQSITHIQEMTLAFVPKIIVVFAALLLAAPYMLAQLAALMERIADRIAHMG